MRSRFVQPQTATLTLANGDTLIVRRRLNTGEQRESYRACSTVIEKEDGTVKSVPDPLLIGIAKVAAYLVDWSLASDDEPLKGLDFRQRFTVLDNLDPEDFYEIKDAIDTHELAMVAERAAEKKTTATPGATNGAAISASPSGAAGASSGSESLTLMTTPN